MVLDIIIVTNMVLSISGSSLALFSTRSGGWSGAVHILTEDVRELAAAENEKDFVVLLE